MRNFVDPFTGYSLLLRVIIYGVVPLFTVLQVIRLRRGLQVFQLEGYKRHRFLQWCRENRSSSLFLRPIGEKKPLVMTGRAWRLLIVSAVLNVIAVLVLPGLVHLIAGAPFDLITWAVMTTIVFAGLPRLLTTADVLLTPVQQAINSSYRRRALGALERRAPKVIGITGSFGKTSTKFAVAGLVAPSGEVLATPGSFNTPMGVVRAINEGLTDSHRVLVVEMGAYREGDIAELCDLVRPVIGVLTAVGPAHLDRFGSLDAIRRAKYELIEALPSDGLAVMNVDDLEVRALADRTDHVPVIRYGIQEEGRPDVSADDVTFSSKGTTASLRVGGERFDITTKLLGRHAIGHILAGVGVANALGVDPPTIATRVQQLEAVEHRLQLLPGAGGVTVIDDAYNSNPQGAAAALEVLSSFKTGQGRKIIVTPGMIELGELQEEENATLGAAAASAVDLLIVVGRVNRAALVRGAESVASGAEVEVVDTLNDATERLRRYLKPGDVVLFENDLPDQYEV